MPAPLVEPTPLGLYCPAGDFYVDPRRRAPRAVVTHAHTDHATAGCGGYYTATDGVELLRLRVGRRSVIHGLDYGAPIDFNGVRVSLHPAGHLLGSAQVRIEHAGRVLVVSGDFKTHADPTCRPLEIVPCDEFVTEATFASPAYRWPPAEQVFEEINGWWRANQIARRASVIFAYALGKAQRILAGVDASIGPIHVHGAVAEFLPVYAAAGVALPATTTVEPQRVRIQNGRPLVIAPPSTAGSRWLTRLGPSATAMASGWMQTRAAAGVGSDGAGPRGPAARRGVDRGFVLSDHADWDGLLATIRATGARRVGVTHGSPHALVRALGEAGLEAYALGARQEAAAVRQLNLWEAAEGA